jgi:hypothetical protein
VVTLHASASVLLAASSQGLDPEGTRLSVFHGDTHS